MPMYTTANVTTFNIQNHILQYSAGFKITECLCNHKNNSTILVYMILNCKEDLTGCDVNWYSLVSVLFNRSSQYSWLFLNKIFFFLYIYIYIYIFFFLPYVHIPEST